MINWKVLGAKKTEEEESQFLAAQVGNNVLVYSRVTAMRKPAKGPAEIAAIAAAMTTMPDTCIVQDADGTFTLKAIGG